MTAMNRFNSLYNEPELLAQLDERELGFDFMHSSIDKPKRGICLDTGSGC